MFPAATWTRVQCAKVCVFATFFFLFRWTGSERLLLNLWWMCLPSWLAFVCVFTNGEWTGGGSCWGQVKRPKDWNLFLTHKSAFGYLDFEEGSARKHRLGRKPLNLVCVGISAPNFYISCSLCIRYGSENTHIPFALRLSFIRESLILVEGCVCVCKSDSVWEFCQASAWAVQGVGTAPGKSGQAERKWAPSVWLRNSSIT